MTVASPKPPPAAGLRPRSKRPESIRPLWEFEMSMFRRLFGQTARPVARNSTLRLERLDERTLPSATALGLHPPGHSAAARSLLTQTAEAYDFDNNGVPDRVYGGATRYNAKGQVLEARYFGDYDNDGTADYSVVNSSRYDAGNKLVGETSTTAYSDGFTTQAVFTYTNDARGNPVDILRTYDDFVDGSIDQVGTAVATFDARGNQLTSRFTEDFGNDGSFDFTGSTTSTYDNRNNLLTQDDSITLVRNGRTDRTLLVATYDGQGNLSAYQRTYESSFRGVTTIDAAETFAATYDNHNNQTGYLYTADYGFTGVGADYTETFAATYDSRNNQLTSASLVDDIYFGFAYSQTSTNTYDVNGNLVTSRFAYDDGNDGTIEYREVGVNTYDATGNLLTSRSGSDADNDGVMDVVFYAATSTYDNQGNRTSFSYGSDWDGDGVFNESGSQTFTY